MRIVLSFGQRIGVLQHQRRPAVGPGIPVSMDHIAGRGPQELVGAVPDSIVPEGQRVGRHGFGREPPPEVDLVKTQLITVGRAVGR